MVIFLVLGYYHFFTNALMIFIFIVKIFDCFSF